MSGGSASRYGEHDLGGVYYAVVTQNDDKDGPGGRVKVRYPWLPEGDRDQSHWAPICVPMIGAAFGTYTLPEIDDEVMVMFLSGDLDKPVVVGAGWSQTDKPPEDNADGKNAFRLIKSRAAHRLIFDDSGKTKVVLTDMGDKHMIDAGSHGKEGDSKNAIAVAALGSSSGVSAAAASGPLQVWCPGGTLSIKAKNVEVTSEGKTDIKGASKLELKGSSTATLTSSGAGKYQGSPIKIGG